MATEAHRQVQILSCFKLADFKQAAATARVPYQCQQQKVQKGVGGLRCSREAARAERERGRQAAKGGKLWQQGEEQSRAGKRGGGRAGAGAGEQELLRAKGLLPNAFLLLLTRFSHTAFQPFGFCSSATLQRENEKEEEEAKKIKSREKSRKYFCNF